MAVDHIVCAFPSVVSQCLYGYGLCATIGIGCAAYIVVARDSQDVDASSYEFVDLCYDHLMTSYLAVFGEVARYENEIGLMLEGNGDKYQIKHNGTVIGQLSKNSEILRKAKNDMGLPILSGIFVSEVYVWTLEDTLKYDADNNTDFIKYWGESAKKKGYVYIVDFAGYAKIK